MKHPEPRALVFDIETSLDIIAAYGLREQYHSDKNILQDWYVICVCWKWLGGSKIYSSSLLDDKKRFKKCFHDDYHVVKTLHELISETDIIIGHNMSRFDWKKFMARVIYHGLPPLPKPAIIDTLKEARKMASFTSNKMSYLAKHLKVENKLDHAGDMWLKILRGDKKAIEAAVEYCKGDVKTTEALYLKLRPYMETHPNFGLWRGDGIDGCRNCGSDNLCKRGYHFTTTGKFQKYQCRDCGSWMQGTKRIKKVNIK